VWQLILPDFQCSFYFGETKVINWDLVVGKTYIVYAISVWKRELAYLIIPVFLDEENLPESSDEEDLPSWYPAELFQVITPRLPRFYFAIFENDPRGLNALWGYKELIEDYHHYVGLIDREPEALKTFSQRRMEIDSQEE
jgi:hypothetical protein